MSGAFTFAAPATKTDRPKVAKDEAFAKYVRVTNLMLDMHWAGVAATDADRKAERIRERMVTVVATEEQIAEANAVAIHLERSARLKTDELVTAAGKITKLWPYLSDDYRAECADILARAWSDSPLWAFVRECGEPWKQLIESAEAGPVNAEPCPF